MSVTIWAGGKESWRECWADREKPKSPPTVRSGTDVVGSSGPCGPWITTRPDLSGRILPEEDRGMSNPAVGSLRKPSPWVRRGWARVSLPHHASVEVRQAAPLLSQALTCVPGIISLCARVSLEASWRKTRRAGSNCTSRFLSLKNTYFS